MQITDLSKKELFNLIYIYEDEDCINQLYKLIRSYCFKNNIFSDDIIQDLMCHLLSKLEFFDESKAKLSTFVNVLCHNKILQIHKINNARKRKGEVISLNSNIENTSIELMSVIQDKYESDRERLVKYIYNNDLSELAKRYFNGEKQVDLERELNISQTTISKKILSEIEYLRDKYQL